MKAYSRDLRERIRAAVDAGEPHRRLAARFGVSRATVTRLVRLRRETGDLGPRPRPGQPARLGAALDAGLLPQLRARPDASIAEHCAAWERATGQAVSPSTMRRAIARLGWTRKQRARAPANGTRASATPFAKRSRRSLRATSSSSMSAAPTAA